MRKNLDGSQPRTIGGTAIHTLSVQLDGNTANLLARAEALACNSTCHINAEPEYRLCHRAPQMAPTHIQIYISDFDK